MDKGKLIKTEKIFEGRAFNVRIDTIERPGGRKTTREIVEHSEAVAVVCIDDKDNILLVRQFRHAAGKDLLEVPAGGIDPGEDPETAVRRELREEIGFLPHKLKRLGGFYSAPGFCTEYLYLYLATELTPERLFAEDTDSIELVRVPLNKIKELIASGKICDAKSIAGILSYLTYQTNH